MGLLLSHFIDEETETLGSTVLKFTTLDMSDSNLGYLAALWERIKMECLFPPLGQGKQGMVFDKER
jgi:hypothetical protein